LNDFSASRKSAGTVLGSKDINVTVAVATLPTATITQVINDNTTPNSFIPKDTSTTDATPKITGTISATLGTGDAVRVYAGSTSLGTATTTGTDWVFTPGAALAAGTHVLKAVVHNAYSMTESSLNNLQNPHECSLFERLWCTKSSKNRYLRS
jgi:hypothetical protein